jgi:predicted lipid-binding transport protein (Tim44 family)
MSAFDPRDADPLHHVDAEQDLWDPQARAWVPRQSALAAMLVALVTGIVAGVLLVFAISAIAGAITAPRAAQSGTGDATGSVPR